MSRDVLDQADDTLAEMCWCGHSYYHHTDSDTPACYWPLEPEGTDDFWERTEESECECDGWYPMNEDAPEGAGAAEKPMNPKGTTDG